MNRVVIEVKKGANDTNASLLRKFQRRVNEAGIIKVAKKKLFNTRKESALSRKAWAIKRLEKQKQIEKLRKLGKIQ